MSNQSSAINPPSQQTSPTGADIQEQIRRRACELYEQRGGAHGCDEADWLQAEEEVLGRRDS